MRCIIEKYVLPSSAFPFHFVDGFFCCTKAFQFDVLPFIYFFLFPLAQADISAKILLQVMSKILLPTFSSRILMVQCKGPQPPGLRPVLVRACQEPSHTAGGDLECNEFESSRNHIHPTLVRVKIVFHESSPCAKKVGNH